MICLGVVMLPAMLGLLQQAGFTQPGRWKSVWLIRQLMVIALLNGSSFIDGIA